MLQYWLGSSKYQIVPGGAAARNITLCGEVPGTEKDLLLRAVSDAGGGAQHEEGYIAIQSESTCYGDIRYIKCFAKHI